MYIFLDESGDLGFDFTKQGTSKFFVITVLVSENIHDIKAVNLAVAKILKKINCGKKKSTTNELKGREIPLPIKQYFLTKIKSNSWSLYSVVVNKKAFKIPRYITHPNHLYNYIAAHLLSKIVVTPSSLVTVAVDKCKAAHDVDDFNRHVTEIFCPKLDNVNNLVIGHHYSHDLKILQAVDLFCYGLFCKYERKDLTWYSCFQDRIFLEDELCK